MQEMGACPGKNLIFVPAESGETELRCMDSGRTLKIFERRDEANEYILALIHEQGPWEVTLRKIEESIAPDDA
jgi:hypothetical protein